MLFFNIQINFSHNNTYISFMKSKVIAYATQIFGNEDAALSWLYDENFIFDGKKPIDLLNTKQGCDQVITVLSNIEKEFYS